MASPDRASNATTLPPSPRDAGAIAFPDAPPGVRLATHAMGTRFELFLAGAPPADLRAAGELALEEIRSLHDRLSAFAHGSVVSRLNAHAADGPVTLAGDLFDLLTLCRDVWLASGGLFDPTIGPLMALWGFRDPSPDNRSPPSDDALALALACVGMQHVLLDPLTRAVRFLRPGLRLDLGAVAKGWALDAAAAILRERDIPSAFLHGGTSSVLAYGPAPTPLGWRVHIRGVERTIALHDAALGVSAPHGRQVIVNGVTLGHVIDPRSGRPARGARVAAVLGPSAARADAWSTAALVTASPPAGLPRDYAVFLA